MSKTKDTSGTEIDKESLSYWKTEVLIKKYQDRKNVNTKELLSQPLLSIWPFGENAKKREHLLLKRKVISQNITILKAKKTGKLISYTKMVK